MARRPKIAVDIDEVLADFVNHFVRFSNERWSTTLCFDDYDENWAAMWGVDLDEMKVRAQSYYNSDLVENLTVIPGAHKGLTSLAVNYDIVALTSRPRVVSHRTVSWIDKHYGELLTEETIHFAGLWDELTEHSHKRTKGELVQDLGIDILIDDQPKHCLGAAECGKSAILFGDYAWNRDIMLPSNVVRCVDWSAVEQEIDRIAHGNTATR